MDRTTNESATARRIAPGALPRPALARRLAAAFGAVGAMYVAFAVGAPWLLRDAPPDSYAVVAAEAACSPAAGSPACCDPLVR